jgi:NitT/TauT family transport system substrate-binding protein
MVTRRILAFAVIAAVTLISDASRADDLALIKLGVVKFGSVADIWVADKNGIFKKHGLDLQVIEVPATQTIQVLQSKSVDIALQIPGSAFQAKEQGFAITLVGENETAGSTPPGSNAVIVPINSPVKTLKDLTGKRLASGSPYGQSLSAIKEAFQRAGGSFDAVQFVTAPVTTHPNLIRSGQVDAVSSLDPYTTQIVKSGIGRVVSYFMIDTIPDQPVGSWWSLRSWAVDHPRGVKAFQDAIKEAQDYMNADPARAKKIIADYTGLDPAVVGDMAAIRWKTAINPSVWQAVADMMHRQGQLQQQHDVSEYLGNVSAYVVK